jgi:hypothetical protein
MIAPRWPPLVLRADEVQVSLAVDCRHPTCVSGWTEVILYVAGLDRAGLRRVLAAAAKERGLCDRHALSEKTYKMP